MKSTELSGAFHEINLAMHATPSETGERRFNIKSIIKQLFQRSGLNLFRKLSFLCRVRWQSHLSCAGVELMKVYWKAWNSYSRPEQMVRLCFIWGFTTFSISFMPSRVLFSALDSTIYELHHNTISNLRNIYVEPIMVPCSICFMRFSFQNDSRSTCSLCWLRLFSGRTS